MGSPQYTAILESSQMPRAFMGIYRKHRLIENGEGDRVLLWMDVDDVSDWLSSEAYNSFQRLVYCLVGPVSFANETYLSANTGKALSALSLSMMPQSDIDGLSSLLPSMPYGREEPLPGHEVLFDKSGELRRDADAQLRERWRLICQLDALREIWKAACLNAGDAFCCPRGEFHDGMWQEVISFGEDSGAVPMMQAYYAGVPVSDIVAQEGS